MATDTSSLQQASVSDLQTRLHKIQDTAEVEEKKAIHTESEAAAKGAQEAINDARSCVAQKQLILRKYDEAVSKPAIEELQKITEKVNSATATLSSFLHTICSHYQPNP